MLRFRSATLIMAAATAALLLCAAPVLIGTAAADTFGSGPNAFSIEFVTIGNPGNAADTLARATAPLWPYGSVDYVYRIGKYEISRDLVAKANAAGNLGITMAEMDFVIGGPRPEMPVTGVSWNGAARFVNWLNTSEGLPAAYQFSTQPGDVDYDANEDIVLWESGDPGFNSANPFRNDLARYVLPGVHEWHKAAYYDPIGIYYEYPTGSDSEPLAVASGTDAGTAVYNQSFATGPADIMLAGGLSPFGVMGLAGNVWEWEETSFADFTQLSDPTSHASSARGERGGSWHDGSALLLSSVRTHDPPSDGWNSEGFRIASIRVPELSSLLLGALAATGLLLRTRLLR